MFFHDKTIKHHYSNYVFRGEWHRGQPFLKIFGISRGQSSARRQLYPTLMPTGEKAEWAPLPVYKYNGESILLE